MKRHKTVNQYITNHKQWEDALKKLRGIILKTKLITEKRVIAEKQANPIQAAGT